MNNTLLASILARSNICRLPIRLVRTVALLANIMIPARWETELTATEIAPDLHRIPF